MIQYIPFDYLRVNPSNLFYRSDELQTRVRWVYRQGTHTGAMGIFLLLYAHMIKQNIVDSEYKTVKYHGKVKFLVFECNFCHNTFSKMESYARKQVKIHRNACCFCSPACRTRYFAQSLPRGPMKKDTPPHTYEMVKESHVEETGIRSWLDRLFGD